MKKNTLSPNGYNIETGGNNHKCHHDTKKKLSEMNKGKNNPQFGKKWTAERREKRKLETIGIKNPNYGRKSINRKSIGQYNLEHKLIAKFNSICEASEKTMINECSISRVCNGRQAKAGGFIWKFILDQIVV